MTFENHPDSELVLYTDGGASPNPGPGGWGVVFVERASGKKRELSGSEGHSTNNRMELTAAIRGLEETAPGSRVEVVTDSTYVRQGITSWVANWKRNGWKRREGKTWVEVKNRDLWQRLAELDAERQVTWHWIKGHAGHTHNERADQLASAEIERIGGVVREEVESSEELPETALYLRVSCSRGRGRWAALVVSGDQQRDLGDTRDRTTANQLELEALLGGLDEVSTEQPTVVFTTSDYLRNGATEWLAGWRARGWKSASGSPVQNRELWQKVAREIGRRSLLFRRTPEGSAEHDILGEALRAHESTRE